MEIKKVYARSDGVLYVIVPKHSEIKAGDYVQINKMEDAHGRKERR